MKRCSEYGLFHFALIYVQIHAVNRKLPLQVCCSGDCCGVSLNPNSGNKQIKRSNNQLDRLKESMSIKQKHCWF